MQYDNHLGMIPVLTTKAGSSLTTANWLESKIDMVSYDLTSLLMKPGMDFLRSLPDLAHYVGWPGLLTLNASLANRGADGRYAVRSHYDGRLSYYSVEELVELIRALNPSMAILPKGVLEANSALLESLPKTMLLFLHATDLPAPFTLTRPCHVYVSFDEKTSLPEILETMAQYQGMHCYVAGDMSLALMVEMLNNGVQFVESDKPAADAMSGLVYSRDGELSLDSDEYSMQFDVIDKTCQCPTCVQKLTRAYLHHLLEHTPLLCQRLLVQHNVFYCQEVLRKS